MVPIQNNRAPSLSTPQPVILDTDIGGDVDDTWALCMLLQRPEIDVRLIVTVYDDTEAKTRLVAKILERLGRTDIPLAKGIATNSNRLSQADWLGTYDISDYPGIIRTNGVNAIIETIRCESCQTIVLALGPQTNLSAAITQAPDIADKSNLFAMAGSIYSGYGGLRKPSLEHNVLKDIFAVQTVLASSWSITWAPLDVCGTFTLGKDAFECIEKSTHPAARVVVENFEQWENRHAFLGSGTSVLYDIVAAGMLINESFWEMSDILVSVDPQGYTIPDTSGRKVRCALKWRDRPAFENMILESLVSSSIVANEA